MNIYKIVQPNDNESIEIIADWYYDQWKLPKDKTIQNLLNVTKDHLQFQILMLVNNIPVATAGLYNHVGLIDKEPRFMVYKHWMARVYSTPENRKMGYASLICNKIQEFSKDLGLHEIYLFTHTAEGFYSKLGWQELERLVVGEKNIIVMRKDL
jgi:hypothetical protein